MNTELSCQAPIGAERRARVLAAVADPVRLRVLDALVLGDISPGELGSRLELKSNLLAHHLRVLEREGLVARHRSQADRRRSYLRLVFRALDGLLPGLSASTEPAEAQSKVTRVVFVCRANSARSPIAAALWSQSSSVPATSAGTQPAPAIAPGALAVAERHQLTLTQTTPRLLPDLTDEDYLVTVCDNAYEDLQHAGPEAPANRLHWSVSDPVSVGSKQAFEDVYADLEGRVVTLASHFTPDTDREPA